MKKVLTFGIVGLMLLSVVGLGLSAPASAQSADENKITICHRTNSATNPYVVITVDKSAADGISGNSQGNPDDHFGEHVGPVATSFEVASDLKKEKVEWGDIIPPIAGVHEGLNWTTAGQAIYNNDCKYVVQPLIATASVAVTPATCEAAAKLTYSAADAVNATFDAGSTPSGTTGPASYTVIATANEGAGFEVASGVSDDQKSRTFTGTLGAILTGDDCVLGEETPPVVTPTQLPNTGAGSTAAIILTIAGLSGIVGLAAFALRSAFTRGL